MFAHITADGRFLEFDMGDWSMLVGGFTLVGLLVWLLLRLTTGHQPSGSPEKPANLVPREYSVPQLPAPPVGMPSVTENTTRNFDPSRYRERGDHE